MTNKISTNKHGFTIIEVVLVLAIAGLIFLMVFVALPALQKGQRDTQRKNDVGRVITALTNLNANGGSLLSSSETSKATSSTPVNSYIGEFKSPATGNTYTSHAVKLSSGDTQKGVATINNVNDELTIYTNAKCQNGTQAQYVNGDSLYAVVVSLEAGTAYCQDNS